LPGVAEWLFDAGDFAAEKLVEMVVDEAGVDPAHDDHAPLPAIGEGLSSGGATADPTAKEVGLGTNEVGLETNGLGATSLSGLGVVCTLISSIFLSKARARSRTRPRSMMGRLGSIR
jgi:hypothetical protein